MVDFVLYDTSQETFGLEANFVAVNVDSFDADFAVTRNIAIDVLDAQAALEIFDNLSLIFDDFWIN